MRSIVRDIPSSAWVRLTVLATICVLVLFAGSSEAHASSLGNILPNGLSSSSTAAKSQVQKLVSNDAGVQEALAPRYGLTTDEVAGAKVSSIKPTRVTLGKHEDNSGRTSSGAVVPTSYRAGETVAAWKVTLRVSASKTIVVKWKKNCSNPLLRKGAVRSPLRVVKKVVKFRMKFKKSKTTKRTVVCPSGQSVTVSVVSTVKGRVRVRSLTKGVKLISQKLRGQIQIDVTNAIKVTCGAAPPKEFPQPPPVVVPPVDHAPVIDVFNTPAHLYVNGTFYVFIEASDPDGDALSVSTSASGQGTITLPTSVDVRWDGSPCPSGKSCYRARVQASDTPGSLTLTFKVVANGKEDSKSTTLPVMKDDF